MDQLDRAKILYEKYLNRTASPEEVEELFALLRNRSRFDALNEFFEIEWERDDVSFSLDHITWEQMQSNIDKEHQDVKIISKKPKSKNRIIEYWKVAAAAVFLLLVGWMTWWINSPQIQIYETGYGETMEIVLNDQSKIILNANSRLTWNPDWKDSKERWVKLEGEAFFDISHQDLEPDNSFENNNDSSRLMPFRVITPDLTVNVLGTSFNVFTRRQKTDVLLKSGKVLLTSNNHVSEFDTGINGKVPEARGAGTDSMILLPGDFVSYSGRTQSLDRSKEAMSQDQTSWTEGFLTFRGIELKAVLQKLEDIYGKTFIVKDDILLDRMVNLGMPYEDWETVSGLMTLSLEIEMIEDGDQIIVKNKLEK